MSQPQSGNWWQALRDVFGSIVYSIDTSGNVDLTSVRFPDGSVQTSASAATPSSATLALDVAAGPAQTIPSPLYTPTESPATISPNIYVQDVNGNWHAQAGVDVTTTSSGGSGPLPPDGTLTWTRRMFARDTLATTQSFKNAFLSLNHTAGAGTSQANQDRTIGLGMWNLSATIASFSITGNVVTLNINTILPTSLVFQPGMVVRATGLSTGTYLNNQSLTAATVTLISAGAYSITAPFTHANVGLTTDAGKLDQYMYSMAGLQAELDIWGTPQSVPSVDGEYRTLSLQCGDNTVGNPSAPSYGVGCLRASYFRQVGASAWGSVSPAAVYVEAINNSTVDNLGSAIVGVQVKMDSNGTVPNNCASFALWLNAPTPAYRFSRNLGLVIDNYGTNVADYAINVAGGNTKLAGLCTGTVAKSGTYTATVSDHTILCSGTFTLTLPTNVPAGQTYVIKNTGVGTITVSSAVNIDAATTSSLSAQYQKLAVKYDGSQYWIVG